ncbi:sensor histidine kinase [Nocardioides alkalitolerans]|uniref:sensor histidine kinase n=1 Tax=Nocardioides alkalitolerans TaxID=281714 RepID=UPI00049036D4|nr:GAF domain-containing sensor histidine kinase [Nocardioides alkalitolerans]
MGARTFAGISQERLTDGDVPPELRSVVEMAADVAGAPMATINIITDVRQHQIVATGFEPAVCLREDSMCAVTLAGGEAVTLADASEDARYRTNPFVDGRIGTVRFYSSHPLVTRQGTAIGTLCVFDDQAREIDDHQRTALATLADRVVDVIELWQRTQELDRALDETETSRAELERSNTHLASFAGQVSHDLRNPLATVAMSLYLLHEQLDEAEATGGASETATVTGMTATVDRALRGTQRMEALIQDLLAYARVGGDLHREEVAVGDLVAHVLADLGKAVSLFYVRTRDLPVVVGDATQLGALLQNLVANAVKFTPAGARERVVEISGATSDDHWRIEVADRGIGIDPADAEKVFAPLTQVDRDAEGSGIGLATCRRIVQAHGGRIGVRPREGGGTVVWFELPRP